MFSVLILKILKYYNLLINSKLTSKGIQRLVNGPGKRGFLQRLTATLDGTESQLHGPSTSS